MNKSLPTASEVRSHIEPASREKSYLKAFALLAVVVAFYGVTFVGCVAQQWWIQLICIPANGLAIGMLFAIGARCLPLLLYAGA